MYLNSNVNRDGMKGGEVARMLSAKNVGTNWQTNWAQIAPMRASSRMWAYLSENSLGAGAIQRGPNQKRELNRIITGNKTSYKIFSQFYLIPWWCFQSILVFRGFVIKQNNFYIVLNNIFPFAALIKSIHNAIEGSHGYRNMSFRVWSQLRAWWHRHLWFLHFCNSKIRC